MEDKNDTISVILHPPVIYVSINETTENIKRLQELGYNIVFLMEVI